MANRLQRLLFGSLASRIITLAALVLLCLICGLMMGKIILENFDAKETADIFKGVTYASVAFALWKLIADSWHVLWRFLGWDENRQALVKPLSQLAVAVTGVGLVTGYANAERPKREPALVIASSVYLGDQEVSLDAKRIVLPYFTTRPGVDDKSRDNCDDYMSALATMNEAGRGAVKSLSCGLRACSTTAKQVEIDVRGFASSQPVKCGGQTSKSLNLQIAERRRNEVLKLLKETPLDCKLGDDSADLKISHGTDANRWAGPEEMEKDRALVDSSRGDPLEADPAREILTRRVDIIIEDAGACSIKDSGDETYALVNR